MKRSWRGALLPPASCLTEFLTKKKILYKDRIPLPYSDSLNVGMAPLRGLVLVLELKREVGRLEGGASREDIERPCSALLSRERNSEGEWNEIL